MIAEPCEVGCRLAPSIQNDLLCCHLSDPTAGHHLPWEKWSLISNVTAFRDRVFREVIKVKLGYKGGAYFEITVPP